MIHQRGEKAVWSTGTIGNQVPQCYSFLSRRLGLASLVDLIQFSLLGYWKLCGKACSLIGVLGPLGTKGVGIIANSIP